MGSSLAQGCTEMGTMGNPNLFIALSDKVNPQRGSTLLWVFPALFYTVLKLKSTGWQMISSAIRHLKCCCQLVQKAT